MRHGLRPAAAAAILTTVAGTASAAHLEYFNVKLNQLNNSGVTGRVDLTFDGPQDDGKSTLNVRIEASGLEPGMHPGHIHGFEPVQDSKSPLPPLFDPSTDGDADGFTELAEGGPFYGPILLTLAGIEADAAGFVKYDMTFAIDPAGPLFDPAFPLENREIVLHGLTTDFAFVDETGLIGFGGGVDTSKPLAGTYNTLLPIAVGEIAPGAVPLPAAGLLLMAGLGGLGALRAGRSRKAA